MLTKQKGHHRRQSSMVASVHLQPHNPQTKKNWFKQALPSSTTANQVLTTEEGYESASRNA